MQRFSRLLVWAVLLFICLLISPVGAQEVTPEPSPIVTEPPVSAPTTIDSTALFNTALIVIGAIVAVAFGVFGYIVRPAVVGAVAGMPEWGANMLFSAGDAGLDALEDYTEITPGETDNEEVAALRREFEELRAEVGKARITPQRE